MDGTYLFLTGVRILSVVTLSFNYEKIRVAMVVRLHLMNRKAIMAVSFTAVFCISDK